MDHSNDIESQTNGKRSTVATWQQKMKQDVDKSWTDAVLLVTCFVTGLTDSAVFNVWSCFVGMQTGMIVLPGSRIVTHRAQVTLSTLVWVSLVSQPASHTAG
jgi:hypothetical protein